MMIVIEIFFHSDECTSSQLKLIMLLVDRVDPETRKGEEGKKDKSTQPPLVVLFFT